MTVSRRPLLAGLALAMLGGPVRARETGMARNLSYGMIGKIKAQPGQRAALADVLAAGTTDMPGCLAYVVSEDLEDADALWVTELWVTKQHHDESLKLPDVRAAIAKGRPLIAGFELSAETRPLSGVQLPD